MDKREYGLVLSGGGTKGAYQVGIWKALQELQINLKAIAGTSIGALNGALFLQNDFNTVVKMYENTIICCIIHSVLSTITIVILLHPSKNGQLYLSLISTRTPKTIVHDLLFTK